VFQHHLAILVDVHRVVNWGIGAQGQLVPDGDQGGGVRHPHPWGHAHDLPCGVHKDVPEGGLDHASECLQVAVVGRVARHLGNRVP
jgi:hypothetical protein